MKTFNIFGTKYKLNCPEKIDAEEGVFTFGNSNSCYKEVNIATKDCRGKDISGDEFHLTLLHELFHVMLCEGQYLEENKNEPLVEWLAKCTHSLIKQGVI